MSADPVDLLPSNLLKGHTVLVTGGGSGINLAIAKGFARTGADVAICGRTEEKLRCAADELRALGARSTYAVADVRDSDAVAAALAHTTEHLGPVNTVVAGAAGNFFAAAESISAKGFRTVVDIDLLGSFHTRERGIRSATADARQPGVRVGGAGISTVRDAGPRWCGQSWNREPDA